MRFEWDEAKNQKNLVKNGIRFETAVLVFDDPHALTERDESSHDEERWITFGSIGQRAILVVVHAYLGGRRPCHFRPCRRIARKENV
jgi:uncharacterized DUF497 family protein